MLHERITVAARLAWAAYTARRWAVAADITIILAAIVAATIGSI